MKYLFLIIRHLFPHRKWTHVETIKVNCDGRVTAYKYVLRDQFGNMKDYVA